MHEGTRRSNAIHVAPQDRAMRTQHTRGRKETNEARPIPRRSPLLLSALTNWHRTSQQVLAGGVPHSQMRHGAHHPLPSECTQHAGAGCPVTLVPSQWVAQTIVVANHRCL
ncbi:hypothetical protein TcCL_Unassigned04229 [Trypanosoma cruzi]|nr:hypothetical protein TcCL_Unassigned04229 [Trypanosoma cruzi]